MVDGSGTLEEETVSNSQDQGGAPWPVVPILPKPDSGPTASNASATPHRRSPTSAEAKASRLVHLGGYRGIEVPLNVFDFTVSRHRDGPELFFDEYEGTLLGDCWSGFESIVAASHGKIQRAACNAHARRGC